MKCIISDVHQCGVMKYTSIVHSSKQTEYLIHKYLFIFLLRVVIICTIPGSQVVGNRRTIFSLGMVKEKECKAKSYRHI